MCTLSRFSLLAFQLKYSCCFDVISVPIIVVLIPVLLALFCKRNDSPPFFHRYTKGVIAGRITSLQLVLFLIGILILWQVAFFRKLPIYAYAFTTCVLLALIMLTTMLILLLSAGGPRSLQRTVQIGIISVKSRYNNPYNNVWINPLTLSDRSPILSAYVVFFFFFFSAYPFLLL